MKLLHRYTYANGTIEHRNDEFLRHRLDGPALESADGYKAWFQNGKRHRVGGPAVEWVSGDKVWYHEGELHRIDGPAMDHASGYKRWFIHGKLHRLDGPAVVSDGRTEYWIDGYQVEPFK